MNTEEKIYLFLKEEREDNKSKLGNVQITEGTNKNNERLLFVRSETIEKELGNTYMNSATYYSFNLKGDFVGGVNVQVSNINPPSQIEMEYWVNEEFENQGNVTLIATEVIKEIFEKNVFDGLKVRNGLPTSNIETIAVSINSNNYQSLAVAKKLGFDEFGYLEKKDYLESKTSSNRARH